MRIQARSRTGRYKTVRTVNASRGRAYVDARIRPRSSGAVRLVWIDGDGTTVTSRSVSFRIKAAKKKGKKKSSRTGKR